MTLMLAQLPPIAINLLVIGFLLVCLIMILAVLIQKPQGGGLAGAFGSGAGSGQTAFGARTGDALTVATIAIFLFYILGAVGLNYTVRPSTTPPPGPQAQGSAETTGTPETEQTGNVAPPAGTTPITDVPGKDVAPIVTPPGTEAPSQPPAATPETPATHTPGAEPTTPPASPETPSSTPANPG